MLKMRKSVGGVATLATLALTLAACGGSSSTGGGGVVKGKNNENFVAAKDLQAGGTMTYTLEKDIQNWNILTADGNTFETAEVMNGIIPGSFIPQPDFSVELNKDLLVSAELTNESPETLVYKIQDKAVWSDGTPISAEDFIYEWKTSNGTNPNYAVAGTTGYELIDSVVGSDNGKTVTVTFKAGKIYADWKGLFGGLLPAHLMNALNPDPVKAFNTGLVGKPPTFSGGPFLITDFKPNTSVTLKKNPKWYGSGPNLETVNFRILTDQNQEPLALQNKEVDAIYPQPNKDLVDKVKPIAGVSANLGFGLLFEHFDANLKNPFLADKVLRKAIFTAVDRQGILDRTVKQFATGAKVLDSRMLLPGQDGYADNVASKGLGSGKLDEAKKLLTDAGYKGVGTKLTTAAGKVVGPFRLRHTVGNTIRETEMRLLKDTLSQLGIESKIETTDSLGGTLGAGDYDIIVFAWVGTPFPYSSNKDLYSTNGGGNYGKYSNPAVDAALKAAAETLDPKESQKQLNIADGILSDDAYTLPLYQKATFLAFYSKFGNVRDNATSVGPTYNIQEWGIKKSAA